MRASIRDTRPDSNVYGSFLNSVNGGRAREKGKRREEGGKDDDDSGACDFDRTVHVSGSASRLIRIQWRGVCA